MASGRITKRAVDALIASGNEGFLWDDGIKGFGAKITKSGTVAYILQFRMGGREARTKRYTIGSHGSPWTPTTARDEAQRLSVLVAQGIDPVEVEKQRRREAVDLAFDNYADRFEMSCTGRGWRLLVSRSLRIHTKPVLKSKPLTKITRADIVAVFDRMPRWRNEIGDRHKTVTSPNRPKCGGLGGAGRKQAPLCRNAVSVAT